MILNHLIILSDDARFNIDIQGKILYSFLGCFTPPEKLRCLSLSELQALDNITTDYLFIGMPTHFNTRDLHQITFKHVVLFDYFDEPRLRWDYSDQLFLKSLSSLYLKTSRLNHLPIIDDVKIGLLPIFFNAHVRTILHHRSLSRHSPRFLKHLWFQKRKIDIHFIGTPTWLDKFSTGTSTNYFQRVDWLLELMPAARHSFFGGLLQLPYFPLDQCQSQHGPIDHLFFKGQKLDFETYFNTMLQSKIVLAPAGHSRWTYRHFEGVWSYSFVISNDISAIETLVPIPKEALFLIPDHQPVLPIIDRLLTHPKTYWDRLDHGVNFLSRYLESGNYYPGKPLPHQLFMAQLA